MKINHWSKTSLFILNGTPVRVYHLIGAIIATPFIWSAMIIILSI